MGRAGGWTRARARRGRRGGDEGGEDATTTRGELASHVGGSEASGRYEAYESDGWEHLTTTGETMDEWEDGGAGGGDGTRGRDGDARGRGVGEHGDEVGR